MADISDSGNIDLNEFLGVSPNSWRKKYLKIGAFVAVLISLALLVSQCLKPNPLGQYITEAVSRGDIKVSVVATGTLKPTNEVQVGSEQSGIITQVFVKNNDNVAVGQPLARLDTSRLNDAIAQNGAALAVADAQVDQARAVERAALLKLGRFENAFKISGGMVPSKADIDYARTDHDRAAAAVREAKARVGQARAQLSAAQTDLSKATIYSPVTGVVLNRKIDPGQTVAASFQAPILFVIAENLSVMKLEVQIDEADVGLVEAGQTATFTVDAYPGEQFNAQLDRVDIGARDLAHGAGGASTETTGGNRVVSYTAVLSVQNSQNKLRPGMTATATISSRVARNQLVVPNAALRFKPEAEKKGGLLALGGPSGPAQSAGINRGASGVVYVLDGKSELKPQQVSVGMSDGVRTAVSASRLKVGDRVVVGQLAPEDGSASSTATDSSGSKPSQ